jgi:hypothetical protein
VDFVWEQYELEARKLFENAADSHASDRFVNTLIAEQAHENNGAKKRSWPVRLDQ